MATATLLSSEELLNFRDILLEHKEMIAPGNAERALVFHQITTNLNQKRSQARQLKTEQVMQQCVLFLLRKGISKSNKASERYEQFARLGKDFLKPPLGTACGDSSDKPQISSLPFTSRSSLEETKYSDLAISTIPDRNAANMEESSISSTKQSSLARINNSLQSERTIPFLDDANINARLLFLYQKISACATAFEQGHYLRRNPAVATLLRNLAGPIDDVNPCADLPPKKLSKAIMSYAVYNSTLRGVHPVVGSVLCTKVVGTGAPFQYLYHAELSTTYAAGDCSRTEPSVKTAATLASETQSMLELIFRPYRRSSHPRISNDLSRGVELVDVYTDALDLRRALDLKSIPPRLSWPLLGELFDEDRMRVQGSKVTPSAVVHAALTPVISRPLEREPGSTQGHFVDEIVLSKALVYVREPV